MNTTDDVHVHVHVDSIERLATMSAEEVDELPYGFLVLDHDGVILLYNRYESRMSRLPPERVLGRSWFRDVAPCTRVDAFQGRFRALLEGPEDAVDRFAFRFHFLHGAQDVLVQLSRVPGDDGRVFMTVVRRNIEGAAVDAPAVVTLDEDRGSLVGPLGPAIPVAAAAFARLLDQVGTVEARALGASAGRALVDAAERAARSADAPTLGDAPPLLRSGVLDATIARAGLGRLALDLTARETTSAIGVLVRPPSPAVTAGLGAFYEGLLATMLGAVLGTSVVARRLDATDTAPLPWLFAVVPEANVDMLDRRSGEREDDVARRLGLAVGDDDDASHA